MKLKIFTVSIVCLMFIGSIGAVGNNLDNKENMDCGCNLNQSDEHKTGVIVPDNWWIDSPFNPCEPRGALPEKFDWRNPDLNPTGRNCVTSVRDQGDCGSCWAFAAAAPIESNILRYDEMSVDLSEQWMIGCTNSGGCNGGWYGYAFNYFEYKDDNCGQPGGALESAMPYKASGGGCNCDYPTPIFIDTWSYVGYGNQVPDVDEMKQAIMDYGPLAVCVCAGDAFHDYSSGIFKTNENCGYDEINHAVTLVGWNDNNGNGYWIMKNSWGSDWGESGYMKIKYGTSKIGYGAAYVEYTGGLDYQQKYGNQYTEKGGEVRSWGTHGIELSYDSGSAYVVYEFENLPADKAIEVVVYYQEDGIWGDGPSLYAYNYNTGKYKLLGHDLGKVDNKKIWRSKSIFKPLSDYLNNGKVKVKITAEAGDFWSGNGDQVFLDQVRVRYIPKPDLKVSGNLKFSEKPPGEEITTSITIKNDGAPRSNLDWQIVSWPSDWGDWEFEPFDDDYYYGLNLKPGDSFKVDITVEVPDEEGTYVGTVRIINLEDSSDIVELETSITVKKVRSRSNNFLLNILENYPFLRVLFYNLLI